jgi:hypothetical protein
MSYEGAKSYGNLKPLPSARDADRIACLRSTQHASDLREGEGLSQEIIDRFDDITRLDSGFRRGRLWHDPSHHKAMKLRTIGTNPQPALIVFGRISVASIGSK